MSRLPDQQRPTVLQQDALPRVTLLVAMRNESAHIRECLSSILQQDYPQARMEVLIFDGQSSDTSCEIVQDLIAGRENFRLLQNPKRTQSAAWNLGIQLSHGDVISIVSGHSKFSLDYVTNAVETLLCTRADMVGGTVRAVSSGYMGEAIALAISTPFGVGNANFRYAENEQETDTVFMGFCWRSTYQKLGGFDEELVRNQDDEFSYRLRKSGGRIVCNPKIVSYYQNRATLRSLWSQYYQYGYWKIRVLQKHPRQMSLRQFVPPAFILGLLGSSVLALSPAFRLFGIAVPLLYLLANLMASVMISAKKGWKYVPVLPLVFLILHVSYGLSFLVGLVQFWNRWGDKVGKTPAWSGESVG